MRLFDKNSEQSPDSGEKKKRDKAVGMERSVAQSRLSQPLATAANTGSSKFGPKNATPSRSVALTLIAADLALLAIVVTAGFLLDNGIFSDGMSSDVALWVPILFVAVSATLLKLSDSRAVTSYGLSARNWALTGGIVSIGTAVMWGGSELLSSGSASPETAASVWIAAIILTPLGRAAMGQALHSRGIGCRRVIVVGDMNQAESAIKELSKSGTKYHVTGEVTATGAEKSSNSDAADMSSIAPRSIEALPALLESEHATDVLIAVPDTQRAEVYEKVRERVSENIALHTASASTKERQGSEGPNVPQRGSRARSMPWQYEKVKRAFDFSAALFLLMMASPFLVAVAIVVKLDSPGPIFFKQQRVGRRGERFGMYKFRSMRVNAEEMLQELMKHNEASGAMFKMKDDPRITRVGKILRKLSIDELPQLFNVLNGTMSLVGPRPPLPKEVQVYEERHFERLDGVPGITGLWQIKRGPVLDFEEMVEFDLEYLETWSLIKDVMILIKTIPVVIMGRGAY